MHQNPAPISDGAESPAASSADDLAAWAAREVVSAFLAASTPAEAYRRVLDRAAPRVGASFASIFLRDETDAELLKLVCVQNWPQSSALHLGRFRVRVGNGPSGLAVATGELVQVDDVFSNVDLSEWWEPARELGIGSFIAAPLRSNGAARGALTCYWRSRRPVDAAHRGTIRAIAEQLASSEHLS